jgi:hypothetical protein
MGIAEEGVLARTIRRAPGRSVRSMSIFELARTIRRSTQRFVRPDTLLA